MSRNNASKFKRRQYFVQKDFQLKFILKFCIVLFIGIIISTGLLFLFSKDTLTSSFDQSRLVIKNTAFAILPSVFLSNLITLGLITLAAIVVTLLVSHKLAGPLFRFQKELNLIGEGNLTQTVRLREKDQITPMADSLNQMRVNLQDKVLDIKKEVEKIIESEPGKDASLELVEQLNYLHQKIESNFKI
ncbi:MAG: methyl-accepting chemotaxis protein [Desulfobacterales bacterium]|nr:MAG: methyl-accepting chemotaxis protein [Desulfobacterales bacterium]